MRKELYILSLAVASLVGLSACSSDEPVSTAVNGDSDTPFEKLYLSVNLSLADDDAGTRGTDEGFMQDTGYVRGKVNSARFFFFDANGKFVTEGAMWNGGLKNTYSDRNVELSGRAVIMLDDIEDIKPKYMVAVLNDSLLATPADVFDLNDVKLTPTYGTLGAIRDWSTNSYGTVDKNGGNYAIMTTTSYDNGIVINGKPCPYVTKIDDKYYKTTAEMATNSDPLNVYVERVCASLSVNMSEFLKKHDYTVNANKGKSGYLGTYLYKPDNIEIDGWTGDVYIRLFGWEDNAVNPGSYLMKHIDTSWSDSNLGFAWNDTTNSRSYWGKSMNYGDESANYPTKYTSGMSSQLIYHSFGKYEATSTYTTVRTLDFDSPWFVSENTNTSSIVSENYPNAVTSVLIKASFAHKNTTYPTGFEDKAGEDVFLYNGKFYTTSGIKKALATYLYNKLGIYYIYYGGYKSVSTNASSLFDIDYDTSKYNGMMKLSRNSTYSSYTFYTSSYSSVTSTAVANAIAAFNAQGINGYKGGNMYWNIPVEHLNNAASNNGVIPEGKYGVVRNHWYEIYVCDITGPGKGAWDPIEPIVPNEEESSVSSTSANVVAKVNILSWKQVVQKNALE